MAKYDWNTFRNYVAFLAGEMASGTMYPHHDSELISWYHDAFLPWDHYLNNIVLFYHDSPITRSHFMDPTDRAIKGFYCISTSGTWLPGEESATDAGPWMDHGTWDCSLESDRTGANVMSRAAAEALHTGLGKNPGGGGSECSFTGTAASEISWGADGSWRLSRKPTLKLIVSMTVWQRMRSERFQLHGCTTVRWLYLTSCQRLFGGHLGSSRTRTCATWPVLLRACQHWVQWWSHNTSWIQGIFTHLHSLHDLYAATATTFLMKNTWLLAGIFMYGTEYQWPGTHPPAPRRRGRSTKI